MQRIWVFQQRRSGEEKIQGILRHGKGMVIAQVISIDSPLPPIIDEPEECLPREIEADLVLDFLRHPDLSCALAALCRRSGIPVVASGKKHQAEGVFTPPT
jgi:hypothetical protein